MKNIVVMKDKLLVSLLCMLFLASCDNKDWDDHYSAPDFAIQGMNFDLLSGSPEYTKFAELLTKTGLDQIVRRGEQNTVLVVNNNALAGMENKSIEELTEILGMHIMPSAVYSSEMKQVNKISLKGKFLKFREVSGKYLVNNTGIEKADMRTLNGVVHEVSGIITLLPSIHDVIQTDPDLNLFRKYLFQDVDSVIYYSDNEIIGYDSIGWPIFKEPIVYRVSSPYLTETLLDNDTTLLSTVFIPTDDAVKQALTQMLVAKNNDINFIIPNRKYKRWAVDTIAAGRFFRRRDGGYVGDTISFLNNYFRNIVVRGEIPALSSSNAFTSILDRTLQVSSSQVKAGTDAQEASNGYYYLMDDITVPDIFYRQEFWFTPFIWTTPTTWVQNSGNISYKNGAKYEARVEKPVIGNSNKSYTGHVARYNLNMVGGSATFTIPFVFKGAYKVHVSYYPEANISIANVKYGDKVLISNWNTSTQFNSRALCSVDTELGTIQVNDHGPVGITVESVNTNPTAFPQHKFTLEYIKLVPVEE